jgi:flagellin-like protein
MRNKRGLSPVIATVLLISLVIIIAALIFLWASGIIKEVIMKQERDVSQVCGEVSLDISLSAGQLSISNNANVPIHRFKFRNIGAGTEEYVTIEGEDQGLPVGASTTLIVDSSYTKIRVIPVLLGEVETEKKEYDCNDNAITVEAES